MAKTKSRPATKRDLNSFRGRKKLTRIVIPTSRKRQDDESMIRWNEKNEGLVLEGEITNVWEGVNKFGNDSSVATMKLGVKIDGHKKGEEVRFFMPAMLRKLLRIAGDKGYVRIEYEGKTTPEGKSQSQHVFTLDAEEPPF